MSVKQTAGSDNQKIITTYSEKQEKQIKQVTNPGNLSLKYKVQRAFTNIGDCFKALFNYIFRPTTRELKVEDISLPNKHPLSTSTMLSTLRTLRGMKIIDEPNALRGKNLPHNLVVTNVGVYKKK